MKDNLNYKEYPKDISQAENLEIARYNSNILYKQQIGNCLEDSKEHKILLCGDFIITDDFAKAILNNNTDKFKELINDKHPIPDHAIHCAAITGNMAMITLLVQNGAEIGIYTPSLSYDGGYDEIAKYLLRNIHHMNDSILDIPAISGDMILMKELLNKGAKIGESTLSHAVSGGNFDIVQFLFTKGARIDYLSKSIAAQEGYTEITNYFQKLIDSGEQREPQMPEEPIALTGEV